MKAITIKKEKIGQDLRDFIASTIDETAIHHLEAWKDRYKNYTRVSQVRDDIWCNHDDGLEVEYAEQELGRELNGKEFDYFTAKFHVEVVKKCKNYINCN